MMRRNPTPARSRKRTSRAPWFILAAALAISTAGCQSPAPAPSTGTKTAAGVPGHVFVINLENKGYYKVWGADSEAQYLSKTLRAQGVLLSEYYGIAHNSNPNYLAQISGQASNASTRDDCPTYTPFEQTGTATPGQVQGDGCVYPGSVPTVAGQLSAAGKSWKGYMEDMQTPCQHPQLGAEDDHQSAAAGDQYATRHNPFVYFESITSSPECQRNVVAFSHLAEDLKSVDTTPNLSYLTPNLCNDGHDSPCVDGSPGGLTSADAWLRQQVPTILDSPAYKQDGMLVITFDESEGGTTGPDGLLPGGTAGGKVGALVLSPFTKAGTTSNTPYNHYSLLASIEDTFSLPRLGYAGAPNLKPFGTDVLTNKP
ncbi:alkaline phosphatase family protein [Arthrobacter oryzae]|uniref:Phosphoesterase family protein n=1 Tax=Arthrobacter oryzae TaxID=409290 RepID=A0A495E9V7_9MICC|nr:alkaline phosphatase family protein [Arthrobacter oryzae]RKR13688.1 phosphoesterase family protein [Arthrobacter oryzae]